MHFGPEALQVQIRLGRLGGCCEDRPRIALHELEPLREILRVIGPRFLCDLKLRLQKRCTDFRDEFFSRVGLIAEALAKIAVETVLRAGPVRQLMDEV